MLTESKKGFSLYTFATTTAVWLLIMFSCSDGWAASANQFDVEIPFEARTHQSAKWLNPIISYLFGDEADDGALEPEPEEDPSPQPAIPENFEGKYIIQIQSDEDDSVGRGQNFVYTQENSNFSFRPLDTGQVGFRVSVLGWGIQGEPFSKIEKWSWMAALPQNSMGKIGSGHYEFATRYPGQGDNNGLLVINSQQSCSYVVGEFQIFEIEYSGEDITKLVADFVQHCGGGIPKLKGSISYDAALPDAIFQRNIPPESGLRPTNPQLIRAGGVLRLQGSENSFLATAQSVEYNNFNSNFHVSSAGLGLNISITTLDREISFELRRPALDIDPDKETKITVGTYEYAIGSSFNWPAAGFRVRSGSGVCTTSSATFNIYEIGYGEGFEVDKLTFDFEFKCASRTGMTIGSMRYDKSLPAVEFPPQALPTGQPYPPLPALEYAGARLELEGAPGEYSLGDNAYSYDSTNANFVVESNPLGSVSIRSNGLGARVNLYLSRGNLDIDPNRQTPLSVGAYAGAKSTYTNLGPGFYFSGFGRSCSLSETDFNIYQIEYDDNGEVAKLVMDFEQNCPYGDAPLKGSFTYDSTLPPYPYAQPLSPEGEPFPPLPALEYAGAVVNIVAEAGEPITGGQSFGFDSETSNFKIDDYFGSTRGLRFEIDSPKVDWSIEMVRGYLEIDPQKSEALAPGVYQMHRLWQNAGPTPIVEFSGNGRRCDTAFGRFRIFEIEYDEAMRVIKLIADFEQRCNTEDGSVAKGSIKYDETLPQHPYPELELPTGEVKPALPNLIYAGGVARVISQYGDRVFDANNTNFEVESQLEDKTRLRIGIESLVEGFRIDLGRGNLDIDPNTGSPLTAGVYKNALGSRGWPFALLEYDSISPCGTLDSLYGEFRIFEIEYGAENKIDKLIADYKKECPDGSIAFEGSIHYDLSLPTFVYSRPPPPSEGPTPMLPETTESVAVIEGENDAYIGDYQNYLYTSNNANFSVFPSYGSYRGVDIRILGDDDKTWNFSLTRPDIDIDPNSHNPITVGSYKNSYYSFSDLSAKVRVSAGSSSRVCSGGFNIYEAEYGNDGILTKLVGDFECQIKVSFQYVAQ